MTKLLQSIIVFTALTLVPLAQAVYFGASFGYMIDSEEEIISVSLGTVLSENENASHAIEGEIGFAGASALGVDLDLVPMMLNYRMITGSGPTKFDFGLGAGMSRIEVSGFGMSDSDTVLSMQGILGVRYDASEAVTFRAGYRYIWIAEPSLFGVDIGENLDDSVVEVGIVFNF